MLNELLSAPDRRISYITSNQNDAILKVHHERLHVFYLRSWLATFMQLVNCKVFVMTLTDLHQYQIKRSHHSVHYVYVFHSLVSTTMIYRNGSFDH